MGVFMASVAMRCTNQALWQSIKPQMEGSFKGLDRLVDNFDTDGPGYGIISPFGDMGMLLAELPEKFSRLTGDYVVFATCCDSDFALLELYRNGTLLEKSYVGECFEDYNEDGEYGKPCVDLWMPLLLDVSRVGELEEALGEVDVFAEDNLRLLSELTGLPIFDDEMIFSLLDAME